MENSCALPMQPATSFAPRQPSAAHRLLLFPQISSQMMHEPVTRQARDLLKSAGFFEQMRRPGHDEELLFTAQLVIGGTIEANDGMVLAANDQQSRGAHLRQSGICQIGAPAARYYGAN